MCLCQWFPSWPGARVLRHSGSSVWDQEASTVSLLRASWPHCPHDTQPWWLTGLTSLLRQVQHILINIRSFVMINSQILLHWMRKFDSHWIVYVIDVNSVFVAEYAPHILITFFIIFYSMFFKNVIVPPKKFTLNNFHHSVFLIRWRSG